MSSILSESFLSFKENRRLLFHRIYHYIYVDNYSLTMKCAQLCLNLLFQSRKTEGFCFTEFTTLSMLMIILSQSNVFNLLSVFFSVKENPRLLFLRIDNSIYIDNYSFTIKCPRLCLNLLFQSKKTQGFCFTEFTTLSMFMIILSESNVFNFLSIFFLSQRKPKAFVSQNLRLHLY